MKATRTGVQILGIIILIEIIIYCIFILPGEIRKEKEGKAITQIKTGIETKVNNRQNKINDIVNKK